MTLALNVWPPGGERERGGTFGFQHLTTLAHDAFVAIAILVNRNEESLRERQFTFGGFLRLKLKEICSQSDHKMYIKMSSVAYCDVCTCSSNSSSERQARSCFICFVSVIVFPVEVISFQCWFTVNFVERNIFLLDLRCHSFFYCRGSTCRCSTVKRSKIITWNVRATKIGT